MKLDDLIKKTEVKNNTVFITLKNKTEIAVGGAKIIKSEKNESEKTIGYAIVSPAHIAGINYNAKNIYGEEGKMTFFNMDTSHTLHKHYKNHPMLENALKLSEHSCGIKDSLTKSVPIRPWGKFALTALATLLYPLTVATGTALALITRNDFIKTHIFARGILSPYLFWENLEEIIFPSECRVKIIKSKLKNHPSESCVGLPLSDFSFKSGFIRDIYLPRDESFSECDYFYEIGVKKVEEIRQVRENCAYELEQRNLIDEETLRQPLREYLESHNLISAINSQ